MSDEEGYKYTRTDGCAVIFAIALFGFGIYLSSFIQSTMPSFPEGFGPPPIILWMPAIMTAVPLVICMYLMATANKRHKAKVARAGVHRYRDETMYYSGDYKLRSDTESEAPEKVYLIPTNCPSCQNPISEESVDWVGPLKAKCPHCEAIIDAKEKTF